jgi:hypothetical protein
MGRAMRRRITDTKDGFKLLLAASAVAIILWFVPYAEFVVYPLRIFVTIIHETAHALAALLTGGSVEYISIKPDGSGATATRGGWAIIISIAGYLGTMLYGALLLLLCKRAAVAKGALGATAGLVIIMAFGLIRPLYGFGFFTAGLIGLGLGALFYFSSARVAQFFVGFLAVESCLNALFDLKVLFFLSAETETRTDALNLQEMTLIPAVVWAVLLGLAALVILFLTLRSYRIAMR